MLYAKISGNERDLLKVDRKNEMNEFENERISGKNIYRLDSLLIEAQKKKKKNFKDGNVWNFLLRLINYAKFLIYENFYVILQQMKLLKFVKIYARKKKKSNRNNLILLFDCYQEFTEDER